MNRVRKGHIARMATHSKKTETLVGVFLFTGFAILGGLILFFGNLSDWFKGRYEIAVEFSEVSGIIKGSTVRLRGAPIGQVAAKPVFTGESKIRVELAIEDRFQIAEGSMIQIGQASLLGDKEIIITPPDEPTGKYIEPGALLVGGGPSGLEFLQNQAEGIASDTRALMQDARVALQKVDSSLDDFRELTIALKNGVDSINRGILNDQNMINLSKSLENFEQATAALAKVADAVDPTVEEIEATLAEFREAARMAKSAIAKAEPAIDKVPDVLTSLEKTADTATEALEDVKNGDGALAALTSDQELKKDMKDFVRNLKKNGVLGYKDEEEEEKDPRDRFQGRRR
ncbi:MAG: MlaD family protein [Akkermansiaceae bacterium]